MTKTFYLPAQGSSHSAEELPYGEATALADYLNGKQFTYSFFCRPAQAQSTVLWGIDGIPTGGGSIQYTGACSFEDASGDFESGVDIRPSGSTMTINQWNHVMVSVDTGTDTVDCWINGIEITAWVKRIVNNVDLPNLNKQAWLRYNGNNAGPPWLSYIGDLSEFWFDDSYIDLSIQANREKFLVGKKPADLGSTGQLPTGSTPKVYFTGKLKDWNTGKNLGTTPDFPPITPYTRPSDTKVVLP